MYLFEFSKGFRLLKAKDELKDQTFFLSQIDPGLFNRILFPIGGIYKL
jgi:tRNA U34 2-thiouridine synthase MnmA/TrmU